jgi:hypothetical protein
MLNPIAGQPRWHVSALTCPLRENVSQQELTAIGQRSIDLFRGLSTPTQYPENIERHCV